MRTLVQKNNAEKRMSHANFYSNRGKYEIRENPICLEDNLNPNI